jgi:signal peptidase I
LAVAASDDSEGISRPKLVFYILFLIVAAILILLSLTRGISFFLVPSSSMLPTLRQGDYILTLTDDRYLRGDIIVLKDPEDGGRGFLVKRLVAVGGDKVAIRSGALFLNDEYASEPYIREPMNADFESITVPQDEVFVLGDNRNESDDSSVWEKPTVPVSSVVGRVRYIYLPWSRMGTVHSYPLTNTSGY